MIFNSLQLNEQDFEVDGQFRETEDNEIKVSFNSLSLGNEIKQYHGTKKVIDLIVFKQNDENKFQAENVVLENFTIDNNGYRATFKEQ